MTQTPQLSGRRASGRVWIILWISVAALETALLWNNASLDTLLWRSTRWLMGDQDAYHWNDYKTAHAQDTDAPFYDRIDPPLTRTTVDGRIEARLYKRTETVWRVLRDLGEPFATVLLLTAVGIYHARRWRAAGVLLAATVAAGALGMVIRMVSGRIRPNGDLETIVAGVKTTPSNAGGNYWELWRGFHTGSDLAFPSGHATLAFATAAALTYLSPKGRWLFLFVAAGCALSRVVMQAHFYGDVLFGAALGWTVGWWVSAGAARFGAIADSR